MFQDFFPNQRVTKDLLVAFGRMKTLLPANKLNFGGRKLTHSDLLTGTITMDNFDRIERLRSTERLLRRQIILYYKLYINIKESKAVWLKMYAVSLRSILRFVERTFAIKVL